MRFVIDTNVVLSALISKTGASYQLLRWLFECEAPHSVISTPLVIEYEDVLMRPDHRQRYPQFTDEDLERFIDDICTVSIHQSIFYLWRPFLSDPKDDMVLETAFNGNAETIVTYNLRDFRQVRENFDIEVVSPGDFWQQLQELE